MKHSSSGDAKAVKAWLSMKRRMKCKEIALDYLHYELRANTLLFKPYSTEEEMIGFSGKMRKTFTVKGQKPEISKKCVELKRVRLHLHSFLPSNSPRKNQTQKNQP